LKSASNKPLLLNDNDYPFDLLWSESLDDQLNELDEEKRQLIADAIQSLTDRQREAIYLRFNRGLEYEEISFLLSLNYQSSRALIHRAIEKIREVIQLQDKKVSQFLFSIICCKRKSVI
jgi:RNA polymerase sigma-70 factor (ECF subfamily)